MEINFLKHIRLFMRGHRRSLGTENHHCVGIHKIRPHIPKDIVDSCSFSPSLFLNCLRSLKQCAAHGSAQSLGGISTRVTEHIGPNAITVGFCAH